MVLSIGSTLGLYARRARNQVDATGAPSVEELRTAVEQPSMKAAAKQSTLKERPKK
jgi:hypothetical protein